MAQRARCTMNHTNSDARELAKFSDLAHRWWDPESEFRPLHEINPLRLDWIDSHAQISGKTVLDIGCGGGILSESMAARGAQVTGIDLSEKALAVAKLHLLETSQAVSYRMVSAEALAIEQAQQFDVVTCMEMLEHVPNPESIIKACTQLVRPGGWVFFSTINRGLKAYLFAVIGAEYILNMLPRGTHDYRKFIKPAELAKMARDNRLEIEELIGLSYNPLSRMYSLNSNCDVNYLVATQKNVRIDSCAM